MNDGVNEDFSKNLNNMFRDHVNALVKDGQEIIEDLTPEKADLLHVTVGVSGEAGELLDAVKKACIYGKQIDVENIIEELGDIEFYMSRVREIVGVSREETLQYNIIKLGKRYPSGAYSNDQATERADKSTPDS